MALAVVISSVEFARAVSAVVVSVVVVAVEGVWFWFWV
jgi:hypothetical protein